MKYLNTLPNSFIIGEKDNNGKILEQYGFPKGGLTYLITGNNIKFYLTEDYFYKNVVWSADAPLLINGVPISVDNLPAALKNIFKVEQEAVDVDTEFDDQSFNPIANAPVTIKFNEVDALQATISGEVESLSGEVATKADIEDIPTNLSELENDMGYITSGEISSDYATKQWVEDQGYLTEHQDISGKMDVSGMTAYTTNDAFSTHTGNTDIHVTANEKETWNNKSDFSGSYNDLTDKPTIPVVPTNVSDFVNDAGYVTQANIDESVSGKADTSAVTASLAALDEKKLDASAYTPTDLSNYYTKDETSGATEISTALDGKADIEDIPTNVSELVNDEGYVTQNDIDAAVSGKVNTTDFNTYSASTDNRLSEDEEVTAAALNSLNAVSGDVNTLSGQVVTISGDVNTLSGSVESIHSAVSDVVGDVSTLSGKVNTDETILTGHTANTDIHVTASDKQTWNNKSDFSGDYNDLTNKPTIPTVPTNVSDFVNDAGYATSGYVDSSVSGKVNTTDFNTYSASTDARLAEDEEVTSAALNSLNDALDGKADIEDIPTNISELVNDAGYATSGYVDSSVSGKMDTDSFDSFYNSDYVYYKQETNEAIEGLNSAVSDKVNTTDFNTYSASTDARLSEDEEVTAAALNSLNSNKQDKLTAGSGITISNNVISCNGGGSTYSAGRGIDITNDIISFNLPISAGTGVNSVKESYWNNNAGGDYSHAEGGGTSASGIYSHAEGISTRAGGNSSHAEGSGTFASGNYSHAEGYYTEAKNNFEHASGYYNVSKTGSTADNQTLFSVGNGTADNARHNAFEIRNNGDIYITSGGTDIKLQDNLGGGGTIDQSVISGSTNAVSGGAVYTQLGGLKLVSLTQAQYDALATKDASTLYIIVN